jgi:hypothetical protein
VHAVKKIKMQASQFLKFGLIDVPDVKTSHFSIWGMIIVLRTLGYSKISPEYQIHITETSIF